MYRLAEHLHKTIGEIEEMPVSEYIGWQGYFVIKKREEAKAEAEAKARSKQSGSRRNDPGRTFR
jgi:hypothetical protein